VRGAHCDGEDMGENMDQPITDAVSAALKEILQNDLNIDASRVNRESRLVDDVGLDSVAFAVGTVAIEDKLGVALSEQELLSCDTVGDLETAIPAKSPARNEGPGGCPGTGDDHVSPRLDGLRP
jgi:acyl carrier protein